MKKLVSLLLALAMGAGILSGCHAAVIAAGTAVLVGSISSNEKSGISQATGIGVSDGQLVSLESWGGFHGDGTSITVIRFSDDTVLGEIRQADNWRPLPLDETTQALVYGVSGSSADGSFACSAGPYLTDEDGACLIPPIETGYYWFLDRHGEAGENSDILSRASLNFSVALYDCGSDTLYFATLDT